MNNVQGQVHRQAGMGSTKPTSRRSFLDYLLGTSIVATLAAILYPILRFMSPPQIIEASQNSVVAGQVNELAKNSGKIFKFGSEPGILIHTDTGELTACSAICTHLSCIYSTGLISSTSGVRATTGITQCTARTSAARHHAPSKNTKSTLAATKLSSANHEQL